MTKKQTRIEKLLNRGSTITYDEVQAILESFGYELSEKGKTSGSRKKFYRCSDNAVIMLHKPHPGNELKEYQKKDVIDQLKEYGDIKDE